MSADILIVDDTPANLRVLSRLLTDRGYKVRPVPNGALALEAVAAALPDLILLDLRMPDIDGYEVCRRLKASDRSRDVPVIFISALSEIQDKIKGFEVGGVDYITKPFQEEEVRIRVETHLTIRSQKKTLEEQYEALKRLESLRESLTKMIVHDLANPLTGILGYGQLLLQISEKPEPRALKECAEAIICGSRTMNDMIRAILDASKMESGQMALEKSEFDLQLVLEEVRLGLAYHLKQRKLSLDTGAASGLKLLSADREIFRRILVNIIGNAIKFSPVGGLITVAVVSKDGTIRFTISDQGPGVPDEHKERIFEKFAQVESHKAMNRYSTGLGLTFCKMAVEAHGGRIGVTNGTDGGSEFWFTLPAG